jgi:hypothetical protein
MGLFGRIIGIGAFFVFLMLIIHSLTWSDGFLAIIGTIGLLISIAKIKNG